MAFDGALQVPSSGLRVRTFPEQKRAGAWGALENKLTIPGSRHDPPLDPGQLDIQDLLEMVLLQRSEGNNLVDAVHELRGEFLARGF